MSLAGTLERILPFIPQLEPYLLDPDVTEVMVNADLTVYVERAGRLQRVPADGLTGERLRVAIGHIARVCGDDISAQHPILDARLEGGSRVAAAIPPVEPNGSLLTVRKFGWRYTLDQLVDAGSLTAGQARHLGSAVRDRHTILISGGTGTGKTTLLNALAGCIDPDDRVAILEETAEIAITAPNQFRFEARRAQADRPAITMGQLVRATLRHRPDRILLGEVRGAEAFDLIQVLNTGHAGSLSTIHANNAEAALLRLAHCALSAPEALPFEHIQTAIRSAIQLVVHVARQDGRRRVVEILPVWPPVTVGPVVGSHQIRPEPPGPYRDPGVSGTLWTRSTRNASAGSSRS